MGSGARPRRGRPTWRAGSSRRRRLPRLSGSIPIWSSTKSYRGFIELASRADRRRPRQRTSVPGRTQARRGVGRDRSRQDRVLLQCQPRIPHAADADAWPARRPAGNAARSTGAETATSWERLHIATACGLLKLVNTLLDFSRIEAGRVQAVLRADRSRQPDCRAGQQLPLGLR